MNILRISFDRRARVVGTIAMLCAAAWLAFNVWGNYEGHLSGLFYTGSAVALPPGVAEGTYRVKDPAGYDGQFYRLIARDPFLRRGFAAFVDNPPLRWRRIGIPGLAWLAGGSSDAAIDAVYVVIELGFVLLGAFRLAEYAQSLGSSPAWGLAFLAVPAVMVSLDRMTVDLGLAALTVGLLSRGAKTWPIYLILCLAPLVRETGMVLLVAWCVHATIKRDWRPAISGALCAVPALAWWSYVQRHIMPDGTHWLARYPFSGIVERTLQGGFGPDATLWLRTASVFERLALAGLWLALALSIYAIWKRPLGLAELTALAFSAFAATLGRADIWDSAYAAGRTMSPLLIVLGMIALRDRKAIFAVPMLLLIPRIALQYEAQIRGALRG
jgi:hypothetical protein